MKFKITGDTNTECGVGPIIDNWSGPVRKYLLQKDYGPGLVGVGVILMCRDPDLNFNRRIRLSKKDKFLYMDIMLDSPTMENSSPEERRRIIAQRLYDEVPEVLSRYKTPDFDQSAFIAQLREWIDSLRNHPDN